MRILIAEDDQVLADGLLRTLRASGAAVDHVGSGTEADAALMTTDEFDLLVVGGGPAGASAAIYSARKGIRTGIVAERFGGQVLDVVARERAAARCERRAVRVAARAHLRPGGGGRDQHVHRCDVQLVPRCVDGVA